MYIMHNLASVRWGAIAFGSLRYQWVENVVSSKVIDRSDRNVSRLNLVH